MSQSQSQKPSVLFCFNVISQELPWWLSGKESTCQCRRHRFNRWSGKIPHALGQLSPGITATESMLQRPGSATTEAYTAHGLCSATREAIAMGSPQTTTIEQPPLATTREKTMQE